MPRGGARIGAGRPKKGEVRPEFRASASNEAVAFEFLSSAVRDRDLPFESRLKAAAILLPFEKRRVRPLQPLSRKEHAAESAEMAAVDAYAPPPAPKREAIPSPYSTPPPPRLRVVDEDGNE